MLYNLCKPPIHVFTNEDNQAQDQEYELVPICERNET